MTTGGPTSESGRLADKDVYQGVLNPQQRSAFQKWLDSKQVTKKTDTKRTGGS
jgi:hypothetical protein